MALCLLRDSGLVEIGSSKGCRLIRGTCFERPAKVAQYFPSARAVERRKCHGATHPWHGVGDATRRFAADVALELLLDCHRAVTEARCVPSNKMSTSAVAFVVVKADVVYSNPNRGVGVRFHRLPDDVRALMQKELPSLS